MADPEPGAEHPLNVGPPSATVSEWAALNLPQDQFDELVSHLKVRSVAERLPATDVTDGGPRR